MERFLDDSIQKCLSTNNNLECIPCDLLNIVCEYSGSLNTELARLMKLYNALDDAFNDEFSFDWKQSYKYREYVLEEMEKTNTTTIETIENKIRLCMWNSSGGEEKSCAHFEVRSPHVVNIHTNAFAAHPQTYAMEMDESWRSFILPTCESTIPILDALRTLVCYATDFGPITHNTLQKCLDTDVPELSQDPKFVEHEDVDNTAYDTWIDTMRANARNKAFLQWYREIVDVCQHTIAIGETVTCHVVDCQSSEPCKRKIYHLYIGLDAQHDNDSRHNNAKQCLMRILLVRIPPEYLH